MREKKSGHGRDSSSPVPRGGNPKKGGWGEWKKGAAKMKRGEELRVPLG